MSAERRFEQFTYDELITLQHGIQGMVGTGSAARWLIVEVEHEMHCKRHESVGKPLPERPLSHDCPRDIDIEDAFFDNLGDDA